MSLFHSRNRHTGHYDFERLYAACPELKRYTRLNPVGHYTIDFADPRAVKLLNAAILKTDYGVEFWDIPANYLCPPIPGRADYIHVVADILADLPKTVIATGTDIRVLDLGVGANLIYPLLGHTEYSWSFVGTDIDQVALQAAQHTIDKNQLGHVIELRHQPEASLLFKHVVADNEYFAMAMCNPPFFSSAEQAQQQNQRKWKNLGKERLSQQRNFGGQSNELWCEGGEVAFICRMIRQSQPVRQQIGCFSTLVSREASLPAIYQELKRANAKNIRTIDMAQGQKKSRCVAWHFDEC